MSLYAETLLHACCVKGYESAFFGDGSSEWSVAELYRTAVANGMVPQDVPLDEVLEDWAEGRSDEPDGSQEFILRARAANMGFPIILLRREDGYDIVDGRHRAWRAQELGETRIRAYVFDELPEGARA